MTLPRLCILAAFLAAAAIGVALWNGDAAPSRLARADRALPRLGVADSPITRTPDAAVAVAPFRESTSPIPAVDPAVSRPATDFELPGVKVAGRLVRPDGSPWTRTRIAARALDATDALKAAISPQSRTDDRGRFVLWIDARPDDAAGLHLAIQQRDEPTDETAVLNRRTTELALPDVMGSGSADLGEVVLDEDPLFCAGIVVDRTGEAVAQAKIRVRSREDGAVGSALLIDTTTDASGRFRVLGSTRHGGLEVNACAPGLVCGEAAPFEPGATGLRIVLDRGGAIAGAFVDLSAEGRDSIEVWLIGEPAQVDEPPVRGTPARVRIDVRQSGAFDCTGLRPGSARLVVTSAAEIEPLFACDDIAVVAGETTRDPRLSAIELSSVARPLTVRVVDRSDRPVPDATVWWRGSGRWERGRASSDGRVSLLVARTSLSVIAQKPGFATARARGVDGDVRLVLDDTGGHEVVVRLKDAGIVPRSPFYLSVSLDWVGEPGDLADATAGEPITRDTPEQRFDATGVARCRMWEPGRYRTRLMLGRKSADGSSAIGLGTVGVIEVLVGTGGESTVLVDVRAADLEYGRRFLEKL